MKRDENLSSQEDENSKNKNKKRESVREEDDKTFSLVIQSHLQIIHVELISEQEFYSETFPFFPSVLTERLSVFYISYFKFILIRLTFLFLFYYILLSRRTIGCLIKCSLFFFSFKEICFYFLKR